MSTHVYIIHFDYRTAILFYGIHCLAMTVYCFAMRYNYYIIVTTLFLILVLSGVIHPALHAVYYIVDRAIYTILVLRICILLEYFWFGNSNFKVINYSPPKKKPAQRSSVNCGKCREQPFYCFRCLSFDWLDQSGWNQLEALIE